MKAVHLQDEPYGEETTGADLVVTKYEIGDYCGSGDALAFKDGKVLYFNLGHCSCYGPFDDGSPDETYTLDQFENHRDQVVCSWSDELDAAFRKELTEFLGQSQTPHVAESEPAGTQPSDRSSVMPSQFSVPAEKRILSDEFIGQINSRRILCELISYYEGIVVKNQQEYRDFLNHEDSQDPQAVERAQLLVQLNQFVLQSLIGLVEAGNRQVERIQALDSDPLQDILRSLGLTPVAVTR